MAETHSFSWALDALKYGRKVERAGWNGKGMFLFIIDFWHFSPHEPAAQFPTQKFIAMKTADNKIVPWLASQTDILAEDWSATP